jgi:hypothetical protein
VAFADQLTWRTTVGRTRKHQWHYWR